MEDFSNASGLSDEGMQEYLNDKFGRKADQQATNGPDSIDDWLADKFPKSGSIKEKQTASEQFEELRKIR